jgi:DNA repair protein RecO (recombination protein O)
VISDDLNHPKMFQFLEKLFSKLNQNEAPDILSFIFELKLLHFIGYGLNFTKCSICDDNENLRFSSTNGGLVCTKHLNFKDISYDADVYQILKILYYIDINKQNLPEIPNSLKAIIRNIIDMLYDEFVSFKTKSRKIIKQIEKY